MYVGWSTSVTGPLRILTPTFCHGLGLHVLSIWWSSKTRIRKYGTYQIRSGILLILNYAREGGEETLTVFM